jgi:hypothetical protein
MLPSVWPGDHLTIHRRHLRESRTGEIAVFARGGRLFAHRVVEHDGAGLVTQGDALPSRDQRVTDREFLGVVVSIAGDGRSPRMPTVPGVAGRLVASAIRRSSLTGRMLLGARSLLIASSGWRQASGLMESCSGAPMGSSAQS